MRKLGVAPMWIQLMMTCVRMVTYSVSIHGKPHGIITPFGGIRQGKKERWIIGFSITRDGMGLKDKC
jgi:hypothetical protein